MNTKQIRTLVVVGLVIVIGGGIALLYRKTPSLAPNGGVPSTITPSASDESMNASEDKDRAISEGTNTEAPRPAQQDPALRARALEIISAPIVIKAAISPESKKRAEEKIAAANTLIQENYDYDLPWLELAAYRQVLGDFDGAIAALDFLSTIQPKEYVSFHNLGMIYGFYLKNYPKSEANFLKSIVNNPQNLDGYIQLATVYEYGYQDKANAVIDLLKRGIAANQNETRLRIALGQYYARHNNTTEALQYLKEALALDPANTALEREIKALEN